MDNYKKGARIEEVINKDKIPIPNLPNDFEWMQVCTYPYLVVRLLKFVQISSRILRRQGNRLLKHPLQTWYVNVIKKRKTLGFLGEPKKKTRTKVFETD